MANDNIHIQLRLENIGPHSATKLDAHVSTLKIGVFAMNGEGKSFISKSFATASSLENSADSSALLLALDKDMGRMEFSITAKGNSPAPLSMDLRREKAPIVSNALGS